MPPDNQCNYPRCPAGTTLAGQIVPQNGDCNPAVNCPAGTILAGQPVPNDGNCNPAGCPAKNYYVRPANAQFPEGYVGLGIKYFSLASLPNNLATPQMTLAFGNRTSATIGSVHGYNNGFRGAIVYYGWERVNAPAAIETAASQFIAACRGDGSGHIRVYDSRGQIIVPSDASYGTEVGIRTATVNGQQCSYLSCGFSISPGEYTTCVTGDALITLADGTTKPARDVAVGDVVKGVNGNHAVQATNRYGQKGNVFYSINGSKAMITDFHPIRTTEGWKIINRHVASTLADKKGYAATHLQVGDTIVTDKGKVKVKSLEAFADEPEFSHSYNLKVEGDGDFFANGISVKGFDRMEMQYE